MPLGVMGKVCVYVHIYGLLNNNIKSIIFQSEQFTVSEFYCLPVLVPQLCGSFQQISMSVPAV